MLPLPKDCKQYLQKYILFLFIVNAMYFSDPLGITSTLTSKLFDFLYY